MTREDSAPDPMDIPGFIRDCVERAGGAVETGSDSRLDVLLPPELEGLAAGRAWARLALSADSLDDGSEPAMPGSPFLDSLITFASNRGTVAAGYLPAGRIKRKGLREEVEKTLLFSNCRTRYEHDEADLLLSATAQFDFKVIFLTEERRERLYVVPVDLSSNRAQPLLAERLAGLRIEAESSATMPAAPLVSVATAYETACGALRRTVAAEAARQQVRVAQRFAVEFTRISDYYGKTIAALERRRARDAQPADDSLSKKVESAQRERERKLREIGDTYGIRVRARLSSVRCLWQPKAFFTVQIDRGSCTRTLRLAYDGVLERLELPDCDACGGETSRLWASPTARLLCPECAR